MQHFSITPNPADRTWKKIMALCSSIGTIGWYIASTIVTCGKGVANVAAYLSGLEDYEPDAKVKITVKVAGEKDTLTKTFSQKEIVEAVAAKEALLGDTQVPATVEGRSRSACVMILNTLFPDLDIIANTVEVDPENADLACQQGNVCGEYVERLEKIEKVKSVLPLIRNGQYTTQGQCGYGIGVNQYVWYACLLHIENSIDLEVLSWLDKEDVRKAYSGEFKKEQLGGTRESRVQEYKEAKQIKKANGNDDKVLASAEIKNRYEMAIRMDPTGKHLATRILGAIRMNKNAQLGEIIVKALKAPANAQEWLALVTAIESDLDAAKKGFDESVIAEKAAADKAVVEAKAAQEKAKAAINAVNAKGKAEVKIAHVKQAAHKAKA